MNERTHVDLLTGLGGFSLAAQANGIRTICMCESDEFRRAGLKRAWPGIPIVKDIRHENFSSWQGAWLITAGVPCQPVSCAGKRRGAADDRWLWPEAIRVLAEVRPRWALFENPPGIYCMGLDNILADVEGRGYEVGAVEIPACALGAFHIRRRVWILAHCGGKRRSRRADESERQAQGRTLEHPGDVEGILGVAQGERWRRGPGYSQNGKESQGTTGLRWIECHEPRGIKLRAVPDCLPRLDDGIPAGVRNKLVAALGDTICWPIAAEIIKAMKEAENE